MLFRSNALEFVKGYNFEKFQKDDKTVSACVFCLSQIGEAVSKLSDEFVTAHKDIPWHKIKGLRNRIVHDYEGVKLTTVWEVLVDFLPTLAEYVSKI